MTKQQILDQIEALRKEWVEKPEVRKVTEMRSKVLNMALEEATKAETHVETVQQLLA